MRAIDHHAWTNRWRDRHPAPGGEAPLQRQRPLGGNPFAGATAVFRSPYLAGIALFAVRKNTTRR